MLAHRSDHFAFYELPTRLKHVPEVADEIQQALFLAGAFNAIFAFSNCLRGSDQLATR